MTEPQTKNNLQNEEQDQQPLRQSQWYQQGSQLRNTQVNKSQNAQKKDHQIGKKQQEKQSFIKNGEKSNIISPIEEQVRDNEQEEDVKSLKDQNDEKTKQNKFQVIYTIESHEEIINENLPEKDDFNEGEIVGGVLMPNLSLKPLPGFKPQYNAIDSYHPEFKNQLGSRANCFNFWDGDRLLGFDQIGVFPPKFKKNNQRKIIKVEQL